MRADIKSPAIHSLHSEIMVQILHRRNALVYQHQAIGVNILTILEACSW